MIMSYHSLPNFRVLADVPEKAIEHFRETAQDLIEEKGAEAALAAALAYISGAADAASRSLITSEEVCDSIIHAISFCIDCRC